MTSFLRFLLFLLIFTVVLGIERALGLPFISLVIASNYLAPLGRVGKSFGILISGILISTLYFIPIWLGIVFIAFLIFSIEQRVIFFHRETLTYFGLVVLTGSLLGIVSHFPLSLSMVFYHLFLAIGCLLLIRFWFMKRTNKWKMY